MQMYIRAPQSYIYIGYNIILSMDSPVFIEAMCFEIDRSLF